MIEFVLQLFILVFSLIVLALGGYFTILAIERLIERSRLSEASAGFVILAVMTSAPEVTVAVFSVLEGTPGISIGDILGSNIFNLGAVMGILAMLGYMKACCTQPLRELTDILFLTATIPLLLVISPLHIYGIFIPLVGLILWGTFLGNTYLMLKKRTPSVIINKGDMAETGNWKVVGTLLISFAALLIASRLVVYSGSNIALFLGVPPILIGAKIVSIGTSLPELTLDLTAVRRGRIHLALGDIIGSNLTNLTLVLGLVLVSSPSAFDISIFTEILPFLLITTVVFWRFLSRGGVSKFGGVILILLYIVFQAVLV